MFKAYDGWENELMRVFDERCRFWSLMEQTANAPWFHVSVKRQFYLANDVPTLAQVVSEQKGCPYIQCVMVVAPPWMLNEQNWGMKRLIELNAVTDGEGSLFYEYTTDSGTFWDPREPVGRLASSLVSTVYDENKDAITKK